MKTLKMLYHGFVDVKDELMVRVYALFYVREYRHRVAYGLFMFLLTLGFLLDLTLGACRLSLIGVMSLGLLITATLVALVRYKRGETDDDDAE